MSKIYFYIFFSFLERSKAANIGTVTPYGTLSNDNMKIVEYEYEDTDQSESESDDENVKNKAVPKKAKKVKKKVPAGHPSAKGWHIKLVIHNTVKSLGDADTFTPLIKKHLG